jgi:superfamily I DNA/RNA helicase
MATEQRLFYVAMTRAMRRLYVSYDAAAPSEFVGALAPDLWAETGAV